jgi:hypothetical protein
MSIQWRCSLDPSVACALFEAPPPLSTSRSNDTNPGAEDNGCAAITGHPGVVTSVANEADQATAIPTQLFVDACLGGP